jgi:hypothetical protein
MKALGDTESSGDEHIAFIDNIDALVRDARKDSSKLVGAFTQMRSRYHVLLDSNTRDQWTKVISDFYTQSSDRISNVLQSCDPSIETELTELKEQLQKDSTTMSNMLSMFSRSTTVVDDAFRMELRSLQKQVDALCAVSDAADAIEAIARIARSKAESCEQGEVRKTLLRYVTDEFTRQKENNFTSDSYRVAFNQRSKEMQKASTTVRENMKPLLGSLQTLQKDRYEAILSRIAAKLNTRANTLMETRRNLLTESNDNADEHNASVKCKIQARRLRSLQTSVGDVQKEIIHEITRTQTQLDSTAALRMRAVLTKSKEFVESAESDTAVAWTAVSGLLKIHSVHLT